MVISRAVSTGLSDRAGRATGVRGAPQLPPAAPGRRQRPPARPAGGSAHRSRTDHRLDIREHDRPGDAEFTCTCCGEGWARDQPQEALFMLPPGTAGELRVQVERLDAVLLGRTHHEPTAEPGLAWWHRRC